MKQHKKLCKLLNVGNGDMQVRSRTHTRSSIDLQERLEGNERMFSEDMKRFFNLFEESTFEGSRAAARKMKKIAKRQTKDSQKYMLIDSLIFLIRCDSEMLSWPNSPLLILLQFVDPNVLSGDEDEALQEEEMRYTPLHQLADLADCSDYLTHKNQLILAKQLIERGANVNAVTIPHGGTPLHQACSSCNVTNLDFVELLLEEGADPNAQDSTGLTPFMYTDPGAPGAVKFLLNWPSTDVNITTGSGASFLADVQKAIAAYSGKVARPRNPDRVQHQFLFQQWSEIEEMLVVKGAHDTGITAIL
jgi:hypothetical protein